MTDIEKYLAMKGFQQQLKALRSNPGNQSGSIQGYRPQPGPSNTPRPPQQTGQARSPIATGQSRTITSQTGQARLQQVRPYPQIAGLQVPIPPVPEATPTSSGGLIQRGNVAAAPVVKKNIEVICLDSDEDEVDGSVSLTRGEPSCVGAAVAGDTVLLLQSPTQVLKSPLLQSVDPLPVSVKMPSVDPLPTSTTLLDMAPTSSSTMTTTTSDSSSALNLNMSHNNSISPLFHLLMAANQQRELFLAANCLTQEASLATYPQATVATSSSNSVMFNGSHVVQQTGASDVQAAAMYSNLQSLTQAQEVSLNLEEQGAVAKSLCDTLLPFSSSVSFKNSLPLFQQHTQVFGTATPHISLSSPNTMTSSAMTSSPFSSQSPLLQLTSQTLPGPEFPDCQNDLNHHHSPSSLLSCSPPSNTLQVNNRSPSISPVVQSSPSQFTPSPSSSSLSPPSPHHQAPPAHTPTTTMPQSSVMTLLTPNVLTSTQSPSSLKLKRSKSHSVPVCHLEVSPAKPLRKMQSSSAPKSYSLEQRCGSSSPNDDSQGTGARSSSVSPISTLSPSQSNSSDCSSSPERQSKPHNQSPQTRMESSVTFRYSSSPSPSNTPSAPYTPCSIPLLSPVAARLLFLSTGTKMPSSPPEDVDKLPPIINKRLVSSFHSTETQKKATSPLLKRECGDSNTPEKKHPVEKKKKKGSSLAKSMELVPTSNDSSVDSFFAINTMATSCATTPTPTPTTVIPPMLSSPLQQVKAFVTTPSPSSPAPMLCSPLPLSRKSLDSVKPSVVSANDNLWAPKSHSGQPSEMSHDQSRVHQPEPLLSKMTLSSDSSLSNSITSSSSRMMSSSKSLSLRSDCLLTVTGSITCSSSSAAVPSSSHSKSSLPVWSDMSKMCSSVHSTPSISSAAVSPAVKKKVASPNLRDVLLHQFPQSGSLTVAHNTASRESVSPCISGASLPPVTTKSLYNSPSISGAIPPPVTTKSLYNSPSISGAIPPPVTTKSLYNSASISGASLPPVTTKSLYNSASISGTSLPPVTTKSLYNSASISGASLPPVTTKSLYNSTSISGAIPPPVTTKSLYNSASISGASLPPVTTKSLYNSPSISGAIPPPGTTNNSHSLCGANLSTVSKSLYNSHSFSSAPMITKSMYTSPLPAQGAPQESAQHLHIPSGVSLPTFVQIQKTATKVTAVTTNQLADKAKSSHTPNCAAVARSTKVVTATSTMQNSVRNSVAATHQLAAYSTSFTHCTSTVPTAARFSSPTHYNNSVVSTAVTEKSTSPTHFMSSASANSRYVSPAQLTTSIPATVHSTSPTYLVSSVPATSQYTSPNQFASSLPTAVHSTSPTYLVSSVPATSQYTSPNQFASSLPTAVHSTSPTYLVSSVPATSQYTSPNQFASSLPIAVHSTSPTHFITSASPVQLTTSSPAAKHPTSSAHFKNSAAVSLHATNITNSMPVTAAQSTNPTPSASSASVPLSAEMSSDSATNLSLIMPEGFEQHVVSGLLQAGPPMTLNKMQSSGGADTQKKTSQAPVMSSSGTSPVTAGSNHPHVSAVSSTQRSRKRSSSDSSTLLSPPPVSCSKLMDKSSLPSRTPFAMKPPSSLTSPPAVSSSPFSLQANSVLPSPTTTAAAATSAKPHPLLLSNGNDSTSCLSSLASYTIQEGVTAVSGLNVNGNVSNTSNLEYGDSLITSPSELLSPPGSTSLPELLKSFTFSVSFSPPLERRQPLTTSPGHQKNVEAALQQRYVPVQSSLKSPDCQRNGSVSQQINSSGISPSHHRELVQSSLKSPDYQRNGGLSQRRSSIEISPNRHHQPVQNSLKSPDCQGNGFNIQPNQQRNGEGFFPNHQQRHSVTVPVGQRNNRAATAILTADHQKSASAISHDKQRRNPAPSSKQSRNSPAIIPSPKRNSKDMPHNLNRSSCLASPNHSRGNNRPHSINNKSNPLPSPTANKSGNLLSPSCLGSGSVRPFDHLGINGDNSQQSRGQLQSIHQGNSSLFSLDDQQGGIIPTSNHQKSSPAMPPISRSTSVSSATTLNNKAILSLRGHGSGTILSPSGHGNGTLLSLSGLANDMVSLTDHSNSTISPIGLSNGTVPHSSLGNIKVSPGGLGNGNMLSPSGLSNGNMFSASGLGNGTLPSHCSHGNGTTLSPSDLNNITMLSPSCLGNSTMVSPSCLGNSTMVSPSCLGNSTMVSPNDSAIGKSTGVSPNGVSNSTMPLPSGIENSAAALSAGQRVTSVISNSCCRNTPPLSRDQKVTRTTLATEQMRCNPVISPSPYSSLSMPSSVHQGSYTVPLSSSPASCTVLPSSGIGSSPVKVTSGCQKNVSVIAHSSDRSIPKLSHDLRKTSTLPLVSSHDYQGWPILSSSNQLATGTAVSRNDQSGFCRPQSGHQGRSQIISPTSQRRDLPSPTTQRCDLPSPTLQRRDLPSPTSQRRDLPSPTSQRRDLPSPTSQRRDLPSPTSQRRDLPSPMTQRRDLPSPTTQRRDLPSPTSQRRDLPSPTSQRRDLPSPTSQRRDLPSPTTQRRDLPSPDRQRNSGHSSFKHPRNSPVSVLNSQRNVQNPQPPDCRQNVRLSSPGYSRNSSVPLSNHNFVISQRSDCNLLSSEHNSSPISTPDHYRNSTSTVFATTCQQSNAVFSSSCHGSSCVPTTQSDHKSSSVMMPGDYHGSSAVLSPNLPRRDTVISPKAKPHNRVQPSTDWRSNNLSQSGSKHQQRDSPLLSPQLPSYQSATAAAARQQGATSAAARTPQQQTSTGRSSPAASVAAASNTSSTVLHPLQISSSSTLQSENVVLQNTSLPSISPSWDSAALSFLSDLFSPEPPAKQRHHSDSSLSKYPQNSVTPPCVGGDRVVAKVQENPQNHGSQTLCKYPQTSATLSNSSGQDIINDLLASFQIPSDPQDSIKKSPASFSTASVQRTPPTVPHPLIHQQQVSSSCMKSSLPRQQPDQTLGSQLSSPLLHQTAAQASSLINDVGLTQQNFATVHENQQLGRSSLPSAYSRPHVQLPSQQGATAPSPASLPKLVPFTRQTLQQNSSHPGCGQALSSVPTPHSQSPITSTQLDVSKFGGHISSATSFTPQVLKSAESAVVNFPAAHMPPSSDVQTNDLDSMSTAETAGSLNLLSILNSLTPSQLESLLNAGEKQPVSDGNDCQEYMYLHTASSTSNSDTQPVASTSSLTAMDHFQHSNFVTPSSANHLPSRPLSSCSRGAPLTAAANFTQESLVLPLPPHPQRSKVINSNTSPQMSHAQFRVRSSCSSATAGVMGQLLQLESTAATAPCSGAMNSSSDTYVVFGNSPSVVRLHSAGQ